MKMGVFAKNHMEDIHTATVLLDLKEVLVNFLKVNSFSSHAMRIELQ